MMCQSFNSVKIILKKQNKTHAPSPSHRASQLIHMCHYL